MWRGTCPRNVPNGAGSASTSNEFVFETSTAATNQGAKSSAALVKKS